MQVNIEAWATGVHIALLIATVVAGVAAIAVYFSSLKQKHITPYALYADQNGKATQETQSIYNRTIRRLSVLLVTANLLGLGVSVLHLVLEAQHRHREVSELSTRNVTGWTTGIQWVLTCLGVSCVLASKHSPVRYRIACLLDVCWLASLASFFLDFVFLKGLHRPTHVQNDTAIAHVASINCVLALIALTTSMSIPRTPRVYLDGRPVDDVSSVSLLGRISFNWISPYLNHAWEVDQVDAKDLKALDGWTRAAMLYERFRASNTRGALLKRLVTAHLPALTTQYFFTILDGFLIVVPQAVLYRLLRTLEDRDNGVEDVGWWLWFWTIALGVAMTVTGGVNSQLWFTNCCRVSIPWRLQLSATIFAKSLRKKDVKSSSALDDEEEDSEVSTEPTNVDSEQKPHSTAVGQESKLKGMRQGVVNLIGIDADRVANFGLYNNGFLGALISISVSFTFLGRLLGWQPLLAGIVVQLCFLPINIYFSKRYARSQDQLMKIRDSKLAVLNEAMNGIRQIKFNALEGRWQKKMQAVREDELGAQWRVFTSDTILLMCWMLGPVMLSAACITVYALLHGELPPSIAFTTLAVLSEIEGTLAYIPELTTDALDSWISLKRISKYLQTPEKVHTILPSDSIKFKDATLAWPCDDDVSEDAFRLNNVNLDFPQNELSVISGRTGSGKSLLLASILGEAEVLKGTISAPEAPAADQRFDSTANAGNWLLPSAIAFVSQQPWIENRSFRENILFDLPHDQSRYERVLSACALTKDIETLTDGDATEIGANGINLSGGQRWRVSLARALYSRAGILIMDDIFSAVDSHVGKHIFENALTGELARERTRILVTHHVALCLPATKYQVQIGDGHIEHAGLVEELRKTKVLQDIVAEAEEEVFEAGNVTTAANEQLERMSSNTDTVMQRRHRASSASDHLRAGALARSQTRTSMQTLPEPTVTLENQPAPKSQPRKFVEDEARETGRIKLGTYSAYLKAGGGMTFWTSVLVVFVSYEGLLLLRAWVLRLWTAKDEADAVILAAHPSFRAQQPGINSVLTSNKATWPHKRDKHNDLKLYLPIYLGLAAVLCIQGTLRYLVVFRGAIKASRKLFDDVAYAVLRAPLRWLDTVPVGRVLNRFTADFEQVDSEMGYFFSFLLTNSLLLLGIVFAAIVVSPYIILCAMILLGVCAHYAVYFLSGAREAKRLDSVAKSPIFEFFSTALQGISTIRAFGKSQSYIDQMFRKIDMHGEALWYEWICNRWLGWRLTCVGAGFATTTAALVISLPGIDAALGGFALAFTLTYTDNIIWLLRDYSQVELSMNATERVVEYGKIEIESQGGDDAPAAWPTEGRLEVNDLVVGYAPDLPAVLKGLSFEVKRNERVGVVGRTGAGKSSLTLALFRFLEATEGSIFIDGLDISKLKLYDLRSRLSIIAQDPVLFSGTVRSNLDPFNEYDDRALMEALQRVQLIPTAAANEVGSNTNDLSSASQPTLSATAQGNVNVFTSLSSPVSEGGSNLSQGQRQLLCLARAIVSRPKIMVLDEATSAVDKTTDELIQRSIREEFSNSTLLVIAHRLSTIADFDRILVMSDGKAAEYGSPKELYEKKEGMFRAMVEFSGEKDLLRSVILGQ